MTAAAPVQIGLAGSSTPLPATGHGVTHGAARADGKMGPSQGTQAFRSTWQSVLAALGSSAAIPSEQGATCETFPADGEGADAKAARTSAKGSTAPAKPVSPSAQGIENKADSSLNSAIPTAVSGQGERLGWRSSSHVPAIVEGSPNAGRARTSRPAESSHGAHRGRSGQSAGEAAMPEALSIGRGDSPVPPTAAGQPAGDAAALPAASRSFIPNALDAVSAVTAGPASQIPNPAGGAAVLETALPASDPVRLTGSGSDKAGAMRESAAGKTAIPALPSAPSSAPPAESSPANTSLVAGDAQSNASPQERLPAEKPTQTLDDRQLQSATQGQLAETAASPAGGGIAAKVAGRDRSAVLAPVGGSSFSTNRTESALEEPRASTTEGLASAPPLARSARTGGSAEAVPLGVHATTGQLHATTQDGGNPAVERNLANERGAIDASANPAGRASGDPAGARAQETFSALDAGPGSGTSAWIHAGRHHAEAGFQDPALGWVGVRADAGSSGIHAALVPGSGDAAQVLGSHIAGLNAYLAEHHAPVETLTVAAGRGTESGMGEPAKQGMEQGTGQGAGQETKSDRELETGGHPAASSPAVSLRSQTGGLTVPTAASGGLHISVMA